MEYVTDHQEKIIREGKYTDDRCRFADTSLEKRERTDPKPYIEGLENEELYLKCPYYCDVQPHTDGISAVHFVTN